MRTARKITEWTPYKTRPVGRPSLRWMDQVEEDLKGMKIVGWGRRSRIERSGTELLNRPRPTQGCRVNRRRRRWPPVGGVCTYIAPVILTSAVDGDER